MHKPSSNNVKGSNDRLSNIGACNTASWPPNINPTDEANTPLIYAAISAKCSDDEQVPQQASGLRTVAVGDQKWVGFSKLGHGKARISRRPDASTTQSVHFEPTQ